MFTRRKAEWFECVTFAAGARRGVWLFALVLCLGLVPRGFALDPTKMLTQYNCQTWSQQNGLPANGINAIAQTEDGYIWLGVSSGLVRFNGINFTRVGMAPVSRMRTTEIRCLAPSVRGGLWFGVKLSAYGYYDGHGHWSLSPESESKDNWDVPCILEAKDGRLWVGGRRPDTATTNHQVPPFFPASLTNKIFVNCSLETSSGHIWAGTSEGLFKFDHTNVVKLTDSNLDSNNITALAEDQAGQLWVGTDFNLSCYDASGRCQLTIFSSNRICALLVDRRGVLWCGTFGNGLMRYANEVWSSMKKSDGLADDCVLSLAEDQEGSLWVGTRSGLNELTDVKLPTFGLLEGLNAEIALGLGTSPRGGLWVGTPAGASYFDGQAFTQRLATNAGLQTHYIKRALETKNGDVFLLSGKNEICIYAGDQLVATHPTTDMPVAMVEDAQGVVVSVATDLFRVGRDYLTPYAYTNGVKPNLYWVLNMALGSDNAILVAGVYGACRIKNGTFEQWTVADGLADNQAHWIFEDTDGSIWVGLSTGIARIRGREIRNIRREDGLFDTAISAIVPDDFGNFWVDSNLGIYCVRRTNLNDFADGKISRVTCVSYVGPAAIKPADKYGQEDSACKTPDGRIWFPGSKGLVLVDPPSLRVNARPPPVHIASLRANGQDQGVTNGIIIPPGQGELEFQYNALSYIAPESIRFRYQLEGYDSTWVEAEGRHLAVYNNLNPGTYTFRVVAANADGVWNQTGAALTVRLRPFFYQTIWFRFLCAGLTLAVLAGIYAGRVRHLDHRQKALQKARDLLETEVVNRTAELAGANTALQNEELKLKHKTQALEAEIDERKRIQLEVERIHQELVEASRMAGMAEVATGVLHNVGNVLNSVNVSTTLLADHIKESKVASVGRVAALLQAQGANVGEFLTRDAKGQRLPAFLTELAAHLAAEQTLALAELTALHKNVEHIKDIVSMQQNYAKVAGVTQSIRISELIEDALRMNESALWRHGVRVIREYDAALEIVVDKHKAMQILINLIRNAKYACDEVAGPDKHLTVRTAQADGRVKISVIDNGIGIPPENLNRIFNHGFTTRKHGHGFGLHSGALAAQEMGGSLIAESAGPGQGAGFILDLPLQPPPNK